MKPGILLVHNYYQIPGGEDSVFRGEAELLKSAGFPVFTYTRSNDELKALSRPGRLPAALASVYSRKTAKEVREIIRREKIRLVWVHNTLTQVSPSVYYAAIKEGVPVLQTIHNFRLFCPGALCYREGRICEDCISGGLRQGIKHKCYRGSGAQTLALCVQLMLHRLRGIYRKLYYLCLTEGSAALFKRGMGKHIDPARVFVKPNFPGELTEEPCSEENGYYLYLGRLEVSKGVRWLLSQWKTVEGERLLIAGTGTLSGEVNQAAREDNSIRYLGPVSHGKALGLIRGAKALIFSSEWLENFPMVIAEAMAVGTPVITRNIGNGAELIRPAAPELILEEDSDGSLGKLLKGFDREHYAPLFRREYEKKYTPEGNLKRIEEILSSMGVLS